MTTVAIRGRILAADTLLTSNGDRCAFCEKARRTGDWIAAFCGEARIGVAFLDWFEEQARKGDPLQRPPADLMVGTDHEPISAVALHKSGKIYCFDGFAKPYRVTGPFYAMGSGRSFACGAMEVGAGPVMAVKAAAKWDTATGGKITELKFE